MRAGPSSFETSLCQRPRIASGRPKGTKNHTTLAVLAIMEGEAEAITRKVIELAKQGDSVALRLVIKRLVSPVRERPVSIAMPKIRAASDLIAAAAALTEAVAQGEITPGEAAQLSRIAIGEGKPRGSAGMRFWAFLSLAR
jgi:hypothetical protein